MSTGETIMSDTEALAAMRWLDRMRVVVADLETEDRAFPADELVGSLRAGISAAEAKLRRWQEARQVA